MQARARARRAAIAADLFFVVFFGGIGVASERILAATGVSTGEVTGVGILAGTSAGAGAADAVALAAGAEVFAG
jgi:predicted Rossmann-fold nucleotide-binding protein